LRHGRSSRRCLRSGFSAADHPANLTQNFIDHRDISLAPKVIRFRDDGMNLISAFVDCHNATAA